MSVAAITAIVAGLGAIAVLVERLTTLARERRADRIEPAQAVASAAATVAASVEALLAPMHAELALLRAEVHALRDTLALHGIPAPMPPFPRRPLG